MDHERFDGLVRAMNHGATRRGALGVLAGLAGLGLSEGAAKKGNKVSVCHYDADADTWVKIRVSQRGWDRGHSKHEQDFLRGADEDDGCCNTADCDHLDVPLSCLAGVCDTVTGTCIQVSTDGGGGCII